MDEATRSRSERINAIYNQFLNAINRHTQKLEVLGGEFPVAILNEIRDIFWHLAHCEISGNDDIKEENLTKA